MTDFRSPTFLLGHVRQTMAFYDGRCLDPSGGFFHFFKDDGTVYDRRTRHLVSSTRFVFNHAMAHRWLARPTDQDAVRHGLRFLQQAHRQPNDGYAWQLDWDGRLASPTDATNHCYGLAFVLLACSHAAMAGVAEARPGIDATFELMERQFWEPGQRLYADVATPDWRLGAYRGQNANMHACEALLAAHEATGEPRYLARALTLAERVTQALTAQSDGLLWEHYRADWTIDWEYNRDDKTNIFRPWGVQVGHLTEWAKLLLQLEARLALAERAAWMLGTARRFFDHALGHGWDGVHGGLVYGLAPGGEPCDTDKYFWVQAESLAAAAWLAMRTGEAHFWDSYDRIWAYSWDHMIDHERGAWYRIRTRDNRPYSDEKSPAGKTDYHTMGACYDVLRALGMPPGSA